MALPAFSTASANTQSSHPHQADPYALHWSLYPKHYVAPQAPNPLTVDGNLDKWKHVPWSDAFDEIRGAQDAPPGTRPRTTTCTTRMKMMWDQDYLYICALIHQDFTVIAEFTERNEPIFQKDSDFEVFLNPTGSCHDYKELEINPINTVWNLMMDKPYMDGGSEHSGRVAKDPSDKHYYEVYQQQTAVKLLEGKIGDPKGATWAVELALAHKDTLAFDSVMPIQKQPQQGDLWRINFSRVEKQGEINWTWQPQRIWDPQQRRVMGKVNMHLPDAWGYVEFGAKQEKNQTATLARPHHRDPHWPLRLAATNIYYAQRQYIEENGKEDRTYATNLEDLRELVDPAVLAPFVIAPDGVQIIASQNAQSYVAIVRCSSGLVQARITHDRRLTIEKVKNTDISPRKGKTK